MSKLAVVEANVLFIRDPAARRDGSTTRHRAVREYDRHSRAASEIAREYLDGERVVQQMPDPIGALGRAPEGAPS